MGIKMERDYSTKCSKCRERAVSLTTFACRLQIENDGRKHDVVIPDMVVPRCEKCGNFVLHDEANRRITAEIRKLAGRLVPATVSWLCSHLPNESGPIMEPRLYRIAPEYRRSVIYAMVGSALLALVLYWIGYVFLERDLLGTIVACSMFGLFAILMIVPLRWTLKVDDVGISRRWLIGWDHWSWQDFASGRIEKRHPITLVDPDRPWWQRTMNLGYLADADLKSLIQRINTHYQLPPAPILPEMLLVPYGFRRSIEFHRHEIRLVVKGKTFIFSWNDVLRVHITRMDAVRRDFSSLALTLPGHEVAIKLVSHQGGTSEARSGASAEQLNEFLLGYVPADRIAVDIVGECPLQMEDLQTQLKLEKTRERSFRVCMLIIGAVCVPVFVGLAIDSGILPTLGMASILGLHVPAIWFFDREIRKKTKQLETWLEERQKTNPAKR
jgi:hypothetical protein